MKTAGNGKVRVPPAIQKIAQKTFRTRDKQRLVVLASDRANHWDVYTASLKQCVRLREFDCTGPSEILEPVRHAAERALAVWWARTVARNNLVVPSVKKERSRRRSEMKKAVRKHQAHTATTVVVRRLVRPRVDPVPPPTRRLGQSLFAFVFDPNFEAATKHPTAFVVHTATCGDLDGRRRSVKKRGAVWMLEADSADAAIGKQVKEFEADGKGYDRSDFTVHRCELCD